MRSPFSRLVVGSSAALLLSAHSVALAGTVLPPVQLVCPDNAGPAFCAALRQAMASKWPDRTVTTAPGDGWVIRFVQQPDTIDLTGHLAWQNAQGGTGRGPDLALSIVDQAPDTAGLDHFAQTLLRASALPL